MRRNSVSIWRGKRLQAALADLKLDREAAAVRLGVSPNSLWQYLNGSRDPGDEKWVQFAATLGLEEDYFSPLGEPRRFQEAIARWAAAVLRGEDPARTVQTVMAPDAVEINVDPLTAARDRIRADLLEGRLPRFDVLDDQQQRELEQRVAEVVREYLSERQG